MLISFFILIFFSSILLCFRSKYIGKLLNINDKPGKHKIHKTQIPLSGGPIIFTILFITLSIFLILFDQKIEYKKFLYLSLLFFVGLADDRYIFKAKNKIYLIVIISTLFFLFDKNFVVEKIFFYNLNSEFYFGKLKYPITITCILLFFIAKNMADGINGLILSHTIISITLFSFFLNSFNSELSIILGIILVVVFYFNMRNQLFLGDSGTSLLAGYLIYSLFYENYFFKVDVLNIISPFFIMGIDMVRLFFQRILDKKHPFDKDNNHFHHVLLRNFKIIKSLIIYNLLSFMPLVLNQILNINIILVIGLSVTIYFLILKIYD